MCHAAVGIEWLRLKQRSVRKNSTEFSIAGMLVNWTWENNIIGEEHLWVDNVSKKTQTYSIYDSTNAWRDNVF
jgi:hypothetical protein